MAIARIPTPTINDIQTQINRINNAVAAAYSAAAAKGGTLPESTSIDLLADTIRSIPTNAVEAIT